MKENTQREIVILYDGFKHNRRHSLLFKLHMETLAKKLCRFLLRFWITLRKILLAFIICPDGWIYCANLYRYYNNINMYFLNHYVCRISQEFSVILL